MTNKLPHFLPKLFPCSLLVLFLLWAPPLGHLHLHVVAMLLGVLGAVLLGFLPTLLMRFLPANLLGFLPTGFMRFLPAFLMRLLVALLLRHFPAFLMGFVPASLMGFLPALLMRLLPAFLVRFLPALLMGFLPALLVRNLLALSFGFLPAFLNIVTFLHWNLLAMFTMRNIFALRTIILLFLVVLFQMFLDQLKSKFTNFFNPSLLLTILVFGLCNRSILCKFQQVGCRQFLQFLNLNLFSLRKVINSLSFPLLMIFLLGFFLMAMLLEERCAVIDVGCVAHGVALAHVHVLLPALLGVLSLALSRMLGLALLGVLRFALFSVLSLALFLVLGLALLGVLRFALRGVLGLALFLVLRLAILLVFSLALLLDLLLALCGVLSRALVLYLRLTMLIVSRSAVRLGVFFPLDLALVLLLVFLFLVLGGKQLLEEPLGLVQLDKDEEDDEAGQRLHCVVKAVELHNTMN